MHDFICLQAGIVHTPRADFQLFGAQVFRARKGCAKDMTIESLKIESKLAIVAMGACCFGLLRLAHVIHLSEQNETSMWFGFGLVLLVCCVSPRRTTETEAAVGFLCIGLLLLSGMIGHPITILEYILLSVCALLILILLLSAILKAAKSGKSTAGGTVMK